MLRPREGATSELYRYSGLGFQFAAAVGVFALAGWWLDRWLGASPGFLIAGVFVGFALGLYSMIKKFPSTHTTHAASPPADTSADTPSDPEPK